MPPEGEDAASHVMRKYGISAEQSRANSGRLASIAGELGFAFNRGPDFRMRNSFDAHRLLTWAGAIEEPDQDGPTGVQTDLKLALFKAHFTDNRDVGDMRSEERRVGKECVSTCRSRWSPYHENKQNSNKHQNQKNQKKSNKL